MPLLSFGNFVPHQCVLLLSVRVTWIPSSHQSNVMPRTFISWVAGQEGSPRLHPPFGWVYCLNKECAFETYQHCTQYSALWTFLWVETPKAWFVVVVCFSLWQVTDPGCWWKCSSGLEVWSPVWSPCRQDWREGEDQRPVWPGSRPQPLLMALFIERGACGWMKACQQILPLWRGGKRLRPSDPRHGELAKILCGVVFPNCLHLASCAWGLAGQPFVFWWHFWKRICWQVRQELLGSLASMSHNSPPSMQTLSISGSRRTKQTMKQ